MQYLRQLKIDYNVRVYTPFKYFQGLTTKRQIKSRFLSIVHGKSTPPSSPSSYKPFPTDIVKQTRPSKYTVLFQKIYGDGHSSLSQKSKVSGVPLSILKKVYDKGRAAWRTGHRVGANESQWGYARVHSFLVLGCTLFSSDFSLFEEALPKMKPSHRRRWLSLDIQCPKTTLQSAHYKKRETYKKFMEYRRKYV